MLFSLFGFPVEVHSDRGSAFVSETMTIVAKRYGYKRTLSCGYNPRSQGHVEAAVKDLKSVLRVSDIEDWTKQIPIVMNLHNMSRHSKLKFSPFEVLFGYQPRDFTSIFVDFDDGDGDSILTQAKRIREIYDGLRSDYVDSNSDRYQLSSLIEDLKPGDSVFRSVRIPVPGGSRVIVTGPFLLRERVGINHWLLENESVVSESQLRKAATAPDLRSEPVKEDSLISKPVEQLIEGDLIIFVQIEDSIECFDVASVIKNEVWNETLMINLFWSDAQNRWALWDEKHSLIPYSSVVVTNLRLTKGKVPKNIISQLLVNC